MGTHKNSGKNAPLGRLANAELRKAKSLAHAAFDPIWKADEKAGKSKHDARNAAYDWLASEMGISRGACHIGFFNVEECKRAIALCMKRNMRA